MLDATVGAIGLWQAAQYVKLLGLGTTCPEGSGFRKRHSSPWRKSAFQAIALKIADAKGGRVFQIVGAPFPGTQVAQDAE